MEKTFQDFYNQFNGQGVEVVDPTNRDQCFDLAVAWCMWIGLPINIFSGLMYAYQIWEPSTQIAADNFDFILNTTEALVQAGDMVVFEGGIAGHVSVAHKNINQSTFESFDQNWPTGSVCHLVTHTYDNVLGWLRFKKPITNISVSPMTEQEKKDVESMNKLRAYNGVWYESQNIINDFEKLKADRQADNDNATKAYKALDTLYKDQVGKNVTLQEENIKLLADSKSECQPKTYTNSFAQMCADLADIIERRLGKNEKPS